MSDAALPEEPLAHVAYCHDGTLEGLLSAVFEAYARHERPQDIMAEDQLQLRLGQALRRIPTDEAHAERVRRGIVRVGGTATFEAVMQASLSDDPHAGTAVYRFIRHAMAQGRSHSCTGCPQSQTRSGVCQRSSCPKATLSSSAFDDPTHPDVEPLHRLARAVMNERHLMVQFLRFEHVENGLWIAQCNPKASVVPLLMDWFCARFNTQSFIIYDETHRLAGVYGGHAWHLVRTEGLTVPDQASDERVMQAAWKRFYRTVSIDARYNPELRRQFMPKRLWKNILEMHEDLPGSELSRSGEGGAERLWRG